MLPRQPGVVRQRQREARREVGRQRRRGRRQLRRQRAQEAPAVQGPGRRPRGVLQDPPHPHSEAEAGSGEQPEPAAEAGGGLVPEQTRQDEAEADGGGLRVPEALVRAARRGEPAPREGGRRAEGAQGGGAGRCGWPLDDTDNVPLLQARRVILGLYSQCGQPLCRSRRRRQCRHAFSGGAARTPSVLLWIQRDRSNVRQLLWTRKGGQGSQIERALCSAAMISIASKAKWRRCHTTHKSKCSRKFNPFLLSLLGEVQVSFDKVRIYRLVPRD